MSSYDHPDRMEAALRRSLVTPEGVDLNLRIGDAGQRIGAFLLDLVIQAVILVIFTLACGLIVAGLGEDKSDHVQVIWFLGFFVLRNLWFIGFELTPKAATIGKRIVGLRVASRDGGRLTAEAVITRNALREVEFFLPLGIVFGGSGLDGGVGALLYLLLLVWAGVFLFFPLFNKDRLRAGDLIAGTWVVRAPRKTLLPDLADNSPRGDFVFSDKQLDAYGIKELHVLEQVLRGRDRKTMAAVANRIRRKIDWQGELYENDEAFLSAYYAGLRARLEQRMLFGRRRKDKHDKA